MRGSPYLHPAPDGVFLDVYVQPRSAQAALVGMHGDALKVKVPAPALEGKANAAVLALLAASLDIPASQIELVKGAKSRSKRVLVHGVTTDEAAGKLAIRPS